MSNATPPPGWLRPESPFHAGELAIQERLGVRDQLAPQARRSIRDYMPDQHRSFFGQLPFLLVGATDDDGQPWASILVGSPGFLASPDPRHLRVAARPLPGDPLSQSLHDGAPIGLLGIELPTRRRNRLNGTVAAHGPDGFTVEVGQSFGNCPQYIQSRAPRFVTDPSAPATAARVERAHHLSTADRALIAEADTVFIASAHGAPEAGLVGGVDVSHRGGRPGFVRLDDTGTLTIPDFVGNFFFNTLGNLLLDPRAGLLFIDFERGDLLFVAADAEILWEGPEVTGFAGAERLVRFRVREVRRLAGALPLRWSAPDFSPLLERTGSWNEAADAAAAARARNVWRTFRIAATADESATIRSFRLEPIDGAVVAPYAAGQHLPIRVRLPGQAAPLLRRYTLSDAPDGRGYRISVKREGVVSGWLHDQATVGTVIEVLAPRGAFTFDRTSDRPTVLISAGVGITPMIAMLNDLLVNDGRSRHLHRIFLIHGVRNGREHAFADQLRAKAARYENLSLHVSYSQPGPDDVLGRTHDRIGRIDLALVKSLLPSDDFDFYLCGPSGLMQMLYDGLRALRVPDDHIHFEAFGPASIVKPATASVSDGGLDAAIPIRFARSGKTVDWRPVDGTLLELAEAQGLRPAFSCRAGLCGTCATRRLAGAVAYREPPAAERAADDVLICCAAPQPGGVTLDL